MKTADPYLYFNGNTEEAFTFYKKVLNVDSADEAEKVFNGLSEAGEVEVPLKSEFWAEKLGMCKDKFGVQWMVNYEGEAGK